MRARALFHTAPRCVQVRDLPAPRAAPGEVAVRTICSGISSGTERLVYRGDVPDDLALDDSLQALDGSFRYPFRYGYACVGRVAGQVPLVFAFHPHQDVFSVAASELVAMPSVGPAEATLFPLVEAALQVTLDAGADYLDRVLVLGAGVVGLLTALLLQRAGQRPLCLEPDKWRRDLADSLGVTAVAPDEAGDEKVPLVIDASGSTGAAARALDMLAHEGVLLVASWFGRRPVPLPLGGRFHRGRLTIRSTQVSTIPAGMSGRWTLARRRAEAAGLLPGLPLTELCTHFFPFTEAAAAFRAVDEGTPELMHAVLTYGQADQP